MNKFKEISKGGWHPEKKESSSGSNDRFRNFKGLQQVASWTGHGPKPEDQRTVVAARPLTSLKDPYSFGPPPRRDPNAPIPPPQLTAAQQERQQAEEDEARRLEEEEAERKARGFQIDTTGISTAGLPPPPKRYDEVGAGAGAGGSSSRPVPSLPARNAGGAPPPLPGRTPTASSTSSFPKVDSYGINPSTAAASSRLAQAGVSVPGFEIGPKKPLPPPRIPSATSQTHTPSPPPASSTPMTELSSRFSALKPPSSTTTTTAPSTGGTSWAQKQSAFKTASQFQKDPTSVSLSDATAAAKTANNFRQRHGDQVADGYRRAESAGLVKPPPAYMSHITPSTEPAELDAELDVASKPTPPPGTTRNPWGNLAHRASTYSNSSATSEGGTGDGSVGVSSLAAAAAKKKPPPKPPKPKELGGGPVSLVTSSPPMSPPPLPLGTKPR